MGVRRNDPSTYVYFLRPVGLSGPTKIGCSSLPQERLRGAMIWSPLPLEIVLQFPASLTTEQRLHAKFMHLHSHSEWFLPSVEIDDCIAAIRAGEFDFEALPSPALFYGSSWQVRRHRCRPAIQRSEG